MGDPSPHALILLLVTAVTFYLYTRPWIRMELVSLLLLVALLVLFYLFPFGPAGSRFTDVDIFRAFGHPALIAICCLMIMAKALTQTGAIEPAVRLLGRVWQFSPWLGLLLTLLVAGIASAFINDTPVLVLMLPLLLGLANRTAHPPARTLMPVNFAILAGGTLTSIGTSTNILVLSIATDLGMSPLGVFDFTATSAVAFGIALLYLWLVAPRLLKGTSSPPQSIARVYEAQIEVTPQSVRLQGKVLAALSQSLARPLPITALLRNGRSIDPRGAGPLMEGDSLVLRDTADGLHQISGAFGVDLTGRRPISSGTEVSDVDIHFAELVLGSDAIIVGRTLRESRFAESHGVLVAGLSRGTEGLLQAAVPVADQRLSPGDVLLVQGPSERIEQLRRIRGMLLLEASHPLPRSPKAKVAIAILAGVVLLASTGVLPIHVAAFIGVVAMLMSKCLRLEGVGRALSLEVVLLLVASLALGQALITTGAAAWIASGVVALVRDAPAPLQIASFMAMAAVFTNFVSNSAAAAIGTPVAVASAVQLQLPMEPFVLAVLFGANLSYATPMAYQTNLMIMKAGGYRFSDFVRVGVPLVVIMLVTLSILLSRRYGL